MSLLFVQFVNKLPGARANTFAHSETSKRPVVSSFVLAPSDASVTVFVLVSVLIKSPNSSFSAYSPFSSHTPLVVGPDWLCSLPLARSVANLALSDCASRHWFTRRSLEAVDRPWWVHRLRPFMATPQLKISNEQCTSLGTAPLVVVGYCLLPLIRSSLFFLAVTTSVCSAVLVSSDTPHFATAPFHPVHAFSFLRVFHDSGGCE
ncbi:hypothetical protein GN958_ATG18287 [Phytophthora infestans]|uniref:Uncharacterized protein n=1 Tax=Phytophthora infestans TaxID=4787 RepID=A0A8S9TYB1_PHYIN|nr:hypothetical protein GN958_ATG18287 [Phytophthora infestans]